MIDRLVQIELESFRAYDATPRVVDLDADVVLIHGRNGSGKTSLLSGIEYAITGEVDHLSTYKDYRKVIGHIADEKEQPRVQLTTRSKEGTEHTVERPAGGRAVNPFPARTRQIFSDRSYLSQAQLARLLYLYQRPGKRGDAAVPPIIRFIRDLLDLQPLEALENGLDVAGNAARLREAYPDYQRLEREQETLASAHATALDAAAQARLAEQTLRDRFDAQCSAAGVTVPDGTVAAMLTQTQTQALAQAQELRLWVAATEPVVQADPPAPVPPDTNTEPVDDERASAASSLRQATTILEGAPPSSDPVPAGATIAAEVASLRDRLARARTVLSAQLADSERQVQASTDAAQALITLKARAAELQADLAAPVETSLTDDLVGLRTAIEAILPHVDGETCPVCERDFNEEGGGLHAHVIERLERLGAETARLNEQIRTRNRLATERDAVEKQIVDAEATGAPAHAKALRERAASLARVAPLLDAVDRALPALDAAAEHDDRVRTFRRAYAVWQSAADARKAALQTAPPLGLDDPAGALSSTDLLARATSRIAELSRRADAVEGLMSTWSQIDRAEAARSAAETAEARTTETLKAATDAWKRVKALVTQARSVRKAASEATAELIKATFDDSLSRLVDDIYFRLVRDERFSPRLTTSGTGAQLTAAIHAYVDGKPVGVSNAAALLSSANLNTAALSLFVALHLAAATQPRTLVFDDPVQSMDDVHASNLAGLLRSLAYDPDPDKRRQLVIATHDRALFDYLALELSPSSSTQRLLLQEITRIDSRTVDISPTERRWKPDHVRFQTVARQAATLR